MLRFSLNKSNSFNINYFNIIYAIKILKNLLKFIMNVHKLSCVIGV